MTARDIYINAQESGPMTSEETTTGGAQRAQQDRSHLIWMAIGKKRGEKQADSYRQL